ncbi:MAG TPA: hypothetical protein VKV06_03680 [Acidimicrobiales bacterium]|nr:hypothetical protein [Acidimicrobiales bacterium]
MGGAVDAGYPAQLLADCLGVTVGTVRGRATPDAWLALEDLVPFVPATTLAQWRAAASLGPPELGPTGEEHYPAVAVVRALMAVRPPLPAEPGGERSGRRDQA